MPDAIVTAVKSDVTAAETGIASTFKADVAKLEARVKTLEASSFPFKTVAIALGVAYVLGLVTPFVLKHL